MGYVVPTVNDFKGKFYRDFPYAVPLDGLEVEATDLRRVTDQDIQNALDLAGINFNEGLFGSQANYATAYLYLSAHYLATNLVNSSQGIRGQQNWLTTNKSGGSVSEAYGIPDRIMKSPYLSLLSKTTYGAVYLSIISPLFLGNVVSVAGATQP